MHSFVTVCTTIDVRSSLSKRLMAWSRDLYMAAEILWVISRFRSMDRPRSCERTHRKEHYYLRYSAKLYFSANRTKNMAKYKHFDIMY